jgi:arabinan endo-1,5-alpha-L-arabinosidase
VVLVGYWPLNENSESKAYDHSGKENHGELKGGVTQGASGLFGHSAYNFDGSNDYVELSSSFSGFQGFSFSAWVYFKGFSSSDRYEGLYGRWGGGWDNYTRASYNAPKKTFTFQMESGYNNVMNIDSVDLNEKEWYHIATVSSENSLYVYINGKEIGRGGSPQYPTPDNGNIRIGAVPNYDGSNPIWLNGKMSEVRIYSHALTPQEVQYLYNASQSGRIVTSKKST